MRSWNSLEKWHKRSTFTSLVLLPFVELSPWANPLTFAAFVISAMAMALVGFARKTKRLGRGYLFPIMFLLSLVISIPFALSSGVQLFDWFAKGAMPFIFFMIVYLFAYTEKSSFVFQSLVMCSVIWAAKVLLNIALNDSISILRYTTVTKDLLLPFNLMALGILMFFPEHFSKMLRWTGIAIFLIMTVLAGYRSQFFIVVIMLLFLMIRNVSRGRLIFVTLILSLFVVAMQYFFSTPNGEYFLQRLSGEIEASADLGRELEIEFAWGKFLSSPIFGVGLGTSVPPSVTFAGRESYLRSLFQIYGSEYSVTYIHNIIMYCLMNLGAFGTIAYFGTIFGNWGRLTRDSIIQDRRGMSIIIGSLIVFNLVAATFTLLQWQVMVGLLSALAATRHSKSETQSVRSRRKVGRQLRSEGVRARESQG